MQRTTTFLVVASFALFTPAIPAASACDDARDGFLRRFQDHAEDVATLLPAFAEVIEACGTQPEGGTPDVQVEGVVATVLAKAEECEGTLNTQAGALPAEFSVSFIVGPIVRELPDWGAATVATTGGALQEAVFNGEGLYSGLLANENGTIKFIKVAHLWVPGTDGSASAHCVANVVAGGSGTATLASAGIVVTMKGTTMI